MKKKVSFIKLFLLSLSLSLAGVSANAQDADAALTKKQALDAKTFINSTFNVLKSACSAKKANKKDPKTTEPFLGMGYDYQKKAVEVFQEKNYEIAINYAVKARKYAMMSIKQNNGKLLDTHEIDPEKIYKNFKKEKDFIKVLKKEANNLKMQEIGTIDGTLDSATVVSSEDPDVKNQKAITELEKFCKAK